MSPLLTVASRHHRFLFDPSLTELFQAETSIFRIAFPFKTTTKKALLKSNSTSSKYYLSFIWLHLDTITLLQQTVEMPWYFRCSWVLFGLLQTPEIPGYRQALYTNVAKSKFWPSLASLTLRINQLAAPASPHLLPPVEPCTPLCFWVWLNLACNAGSTIFAGFVS